MEKSAHLREFGFFSLHFLHNPGNVKNRQYSKKFGAASFN